MRGQDHQATGGPNALAGTDPSTREPVRAPESSPSPPAGNASPHVARPDRPALSLQIKVPLLVLLTTIPILLVSGALAYRQQRQSALANLSVLASETARVIERALTHDMLVSDFDHLQAILDSLAEDGPVRSLYLLDATGRVAFAPNRENVGAILNNGVADCQPCHALEASQRPAGVVVRDGDGAQVFRSMQPILLRPACAECHDPDQRLIGMLLIDLSTAPFEAPLLATVQNNLAWWLAAVLLITLLVLFMINRWVLRRLRRLAGAMESFGQSGTVASQADESADEIGRLSSTFHDMVHEVERREAENRSLSDALSARSEERGTLVRRLIGAQEEERGRLAHELHDDLGQALSSTAFHLELAARSLSSEPNATARYLDRAKELIEETVDRMYGLILGLRPSALDDLGLVPALHAQAKQTLEASGMAFSMQVEGLPERLPKEMETVLFRIFQEALSNAARHSRATRVEIRLTARDGFLRGEVSDNGSGFRPESLSSNPGKGRGLGLLGMRERAEPLRGKVEVESRPGGGTRVHICFPLGEAAYA